MLSDIGVGYHFEAVAQVRQHKVVNGSPDRVEGAEATEATEVSPHPVDKATIHAIIRRNARGLCPQE